MSTKHILLAAPSSAERHALANALQAACPEAQLTYVQSAPELIACLDERGVHSVSFALVDLELPGLRSDGVLERLSADSRYRNLPVIVMGDTEDAREVIETYQFGASAYIRVPADEAARNKAARALTDFWLEINVTPKPEVSLF